MFDRHGLGSGGEAFDLWLIVAERRLQANGDPIKLAEIDRLLRVVKETGRIPDEWKQRV
jgi:hypothetical protein